MLKTYLTTSYKYAETDKDVAEVNDLNLGNLNFELGAIPAKDFASTLTAALEAIDTQGVESIEVTKAVNQQALGINTVTIDIEVIADFAPIGQTRLTGTDISDQETTINRSQLLPQAPPPPSPQVQNLIAASETWAFYQLFPAFYNAPQEEEEEE
jgi:hypothetical protein